MTITRNFKLCLNAGTQNAPYINANQYDEGEEWVFDLYTEGGQKFTPSTGAIIGIKSDGHAILNSGTVNSDGQVVITETQQMTAASGLAVFELLIEGETHGTANFIVNVERRPSDDAEFSDSDLSMLQEAIDAAEVINEILDEGGDPSEIIEENVNAWLDNHPEATTTVEDGAITAPKINQSLWDKLLVSEEVSGAVASFDDGADDVPVSSLKVALEPIQTGSGDPSPSNIRPIYPANGKNMFDPSTLLSGYYVDKDTDTLSGSTSNYRTAELALYQGTYTISFSNTVNIVRYREKGIVSSSNVATGVKSYTFTISTNATVALGFRMPDVAWDDSTTIQIERGSSVSSFQPYQGIMVDVEGKNLAESKLEGMNIFGAGQINTDANYWLYYGKVKQGVVYTITSDDASGFVGGFFTSEPHQGSVSYNGQRIVQTAKTITAPIDGYLLFRTNAGYTNGQIEVGTTASDYEAYNGNSYPYTLGREVYGGSVDLATGVLTINRVSVTVDGSYSGSLGVVNSTVTNPNGKVYIYRINQAWFDGMKQLALSDSYTNVDKTASALETNEFYPNSGSGGVNTNFYFVCPDPTVTDIDGVRTWLASHPFQLVYGLAEPQTINLTPTQVKTLLGYNNISSTGTVDVIYHADTKLYIDKKIGELS